MMSSFTGFLYKYKPAVRIVWLLLLAGLVWLGVGLMLISISSHWLYPVVSPSLLLLAMAVLMPAIASRLANWMEKNIPECLPVFSIPLDHRRRIRTTNGLERVNKEIRRRTCGQYLSQ